MKVFYVHHALRNVGNQPSPEDGLKALGVKDAKNTAKLFEDAFKKIKFKAIYTSPFFRCTETAKLINKYIKLPIIEDARFNEFFDVHYAVKHPLLPTKKESWEQCQTRIIEALEDIVNKYDDDDAVICVTSGVNITAFVCVAFGILPSNSNPFPLVPSCSPMGFDINKDSFKRLKLLKTNSKHK